MKLRLILLLSVFTVSLRAQEPLTLEQAIAHVLEQNFAVRIERNTVREAVNNNTAANAGYLPTIDLTADQFWSNYNTRQVFFSGQVNESSGAKNQSTAIAARLDWTFFDGFRMFAVDRRLQLQEDAARFQLTAEMEMQIYQVAVLYYTILQEQQLETVYRQALELSSERYKLIELKLANGAATQLQLLQARLDLTADSSAFLQHSKRVSDLKVDLNTVMGEDPYTPFTIAGSIAPAPSLAWEAAWQQAQIQNTQLLLAKSAIAITEMQQKELRAAYYPQIGVYGQYIYGAQQNQVGILNSSRTFGPGVGLTLQWTILDRLSTYTALKNNNLYRENAQLVQQQQEQFIKAELRKTFNEYEWARQNLELEQQSILNTEEAFEIARQSYENGSITALELREIQYAIVEAQSRLSLAQLTLKTAELNISLSTGNFRQLLSN